MAEKTNTIHTNTCTETESLAAKAIVSILIPLNPNVIRAPVAQYEAISKLPETGSPAIKSELRGRAGRYSHRFL
jgi:hypothetical protein